MKVQMHKCEECELFWHKDGIADVENPQCPICGSSLIPAESYIHEHTILNLPPKGSQTPCGVCFRLFEDWSTGAFDADGWEICPVCVKNWNSTEQPPDAYLKELNTVKYAKMVATGRLSPPKWWTPTKRQRLALKGVGRETVGNEPGWPLECVARLNIKK